MENILFKLIRTHLKDEFKIDDNISLKYVDDQDDWELGHLYTFGYVGPVPTYRVINPNDVAWRSVNIKQIVMDKLELLTKMIGNMKIRAVMDNSFAIVDESGNDIKNKDYIPKRTKLEIKKGISELDGKFFELPKSNTMKTYVEPGTKISFEFGNFNFEMGGDYIDVFIRVNKSNILTPDGDIRPTIDVRKDDSENETIFEYLNYEWPEFAESLFWGIFTKTGLMNNKSFYDEDVDYFRFYFQY